MSSISRFLSGEEFNYSLEEEGKSVSNEERGSKVNKSVRIPEECGNSQSSEKRNLSELSRMRELPKLLE